MKKLFLLSVVFVPLFSVSASDGGKKKPGQGYAYHAKVVDAVEEQERKLHGDAPGFTPSEFVKKARYYGKASNDAKHEWDD